MMVGQKVICIDDVFPAGAELLYLELPKKDKVYVIRNVLIGVNWKGDPGEVCVYLVGMHNPKSNTPPFPERGFNSERFRPLEEDVNEESAEEDVVVANGNELVFK